MDMLVMYIYYVYRPIYVQEDGGRKICIYICLLHVILQNIHRETMRLCITELLSATPHIHLTNYDNPLPKSPS